MLDYSIDKPIMLLHQTFETTVSSHADHRALVREGVTTRYADLADHVEGIAAALRADGIQRGERVALFLDNCVEMIAAMYAVLKIGAVFMPVNTLTKADKLAYILNDAEASALLTQQELAETSRAALAQNRSVRHCYMLTAYAQGKADTGTADARERPFPPALPQAACSPTHPDLIDQDLAAIIYTSGSTGDAKGVMLTHLNMLTALHSVRSYLGLRQDDIIVCALPLAFDYGLYQVLMAFSLGATVLLERSFTFPVKVLERMAQERATVFPGVPTMFTLLTNLKTLHEFDLSALRLITNTAAALPQTQIAQIRALFPQATLFSMYGLTECKRVTYLPPEQLDIRPASVGRGMPNEEVWLVDDEGRRLPWGSTGELVIRGSHVMRGYWRKPEQTAQRLRPGPIPGEMVLYSGDLFRTDDEGWLYFVARRDDIIKSRGEKVSPREVENVLHALEGVLEAAVIGVDDPLLGQAVKAFVVCKPGVSLSEREVIKHCLANIENFMAPKYVEFVDALPRTDTGKIKKTGLR
ncbi:class I adenylate-forming enzyme family protein [Thiomonas bhubaneswarensis]|uniref:Acyl-CoA synthetase (AMP-forming)/AMP-acid ligase II n=1 Tax=Thiomonas bhubaneswarensis TaxID=339866 RepID=A0A0K6I6X7_9BURK|nr:AMP-binding protein [Thiomonas bhubaneswarensis]CUA98894.1 Acyl-CoA synthetase (AMP-forming)/AMP-acid ligase II [Thiomonas bhubaneswarensis]